MDAGAAFTLLVGITESGGPDLRGDARLMGRRSAESSDPPPGLRRNAFETGLEWLADPDIVCANFGNTARVCDESYITIQRH